VLSKEKWQSLQRENSRMKPQDILFLFVLLPQTNNSGKQSHVCRLPVLLKMHFSQQQPPQERAAASAISCLNLPRPAGVTRATESLGTRVQPGHRSSSPHPPGEPAQAITIHGEMALKNKEYGRAKLE